jgi:catechol 2,3-dioxygenase-like lactoylglutathione lyase family enzyme
MSLPSDGKGRNFAGERSTSRKCVLHSISVQTENFDRAFHFYTEIVGLMVVDGPGTFEDRTLAWLQAGAMQIELYSLPTGSTAVPFDERHVGPHHVAFVSEDFDELVEHLRQNDVRIIRGPFVPATGNPRQSRIVFIEGPDGDAIQFREPAK